MVVPVGMPAPVMVWPTINPVRGLTAVTVGLPAVTVPVKCEDRTVKVPGWPVVKVTVGGLEIGGGGTTVSVKDCEAIGVMPLLAVIVNGKTPAADGVPIKVAVPSPLSTKVTPCGKVPVRFRFAVG